VCFGRPAAIPLDAHTCDEIAVQPYIFFRRVEKTGGKTSPAAVTVSPDTEVWSQL
jgi:hypothetical protein